MRRAATSGRCPLVPHFHCGQGGHAATTARMAVRPARLGGPRLLGCEQPAGRWPRGLREGAGIQLRCSGVPLTTSATPPLLWTIAPAARRLATAAAATSGTPPDRRATATDMESAVETVGRLLASPRARDKEAGRTLAAQLLAQQQPLPDGPTLSSCSPSTLQAIAAASPTKVRSLPTSRCVVPLAHSQWTITTAWCAHLQALAALKRLKHRLTLLSSPPAIACPLSSSPYPLWYGECCVAYPCHGARCSDQGASVEAVKGLVRGCLDGGNAVAARQVFEAMRQRW
jgi:hypothetical protein